MRNNGKKERKKWFARVVRFYGSGSPSKIPKPALLYRRNYFKHKKPKKETFIYTPLRCPNTMAAWLEGIHSGDFGPHRNRFVFHAP